MATNYNEVETKSIPPQKDNVSEEQSVPSKKIVISGQVSERKKSIFERLAITMVGPDGLKGIGRYLGKEILLPAIRDMTYNSFMSGISMLIYGNDMPRGRTDGRYSNSWAYPNTPSKRNSNSYKTNYQTASNRRNAPIESNGGVVEYVLPTRSDAVAVLEQMKDDINRFGQVSIAEYYDYIGVDATYTDQTHGWVDLHTASISPIRGGSGYVINFPASDVL